MNDYHINGQPIIDQSNWCDYCGKDMTKINPIEIQGRTLHVHARCLTKTQEFYAL